ncbi:MAG: hypothetical protein ACM3JG_10585, partial [Thiohalocapsa sp.]
LKTADFRLHTRSRRLADPTQFADTLFRAARHLLDGEADGDTRYRLIGIGADALVDERAADPPALFPGLFDDPARTHQLADAVDEIRRQFGGAAVTYGRNRRQP